MLCLPATMTSYKKLDSPSGLPANKLSQGQENRALNQKQKTKHYQKLGAIHGDKKKVASQLNPDQSPLKTKNVPSCSGSSSSPVSSFDSPSKVHIEPVESILSNLANVSISPPSHKAAGLPTVAEEWTPQSRYPLKQVDIPAVPSSFKDNFDNNSSFGHNKHLAGAAMDSSLDESGMFDQDFGEMTWDFEEDPDVFLNGGSDVIGACAAPLANGEASSRNTGSADARNLHTKSSFPKKKKVQIMEDSHSEGIISYRLRPDSICKVSFPARTWDTMMQSFRIALETDNVFVCDHFLGRDAAVSVFVEFICLRDGGHFDRHMRTQAASMSNYACLSLTREDLSHKNVDGLALMVFKLANYYTSSWMGMSVDLSYFPAGHPCQTFPKQEGSSRNQLKCIYFFDPDWDWTEDDENTCDTPQTRTRAKDYYGSLTIDTPVNKTKVDPVFDRLVVFWGDSLSHNMARCPKERYMVTLSLFR